MNLLCAPASRVFPSLSFDLRVDLFSKSGFKSRGSAGASIARKISKEKLAPIQEAWDLLALALAVVSADYAHHRRASADGWTREIQITVAVSDPTLWTKNVGLVEKLLRFLTTDIWRVSFVAGGYVHKTSEDAVAPIEDSVVLLSGGLDSLIGTADLLASGRQPIAVSHIVRGDGVKQVRFATRLGHGKLRLLQLNHNADIPYAESPPSQRSRSIAFLAYGVLAASALKIYAHGSTVDLLVCENGFIGINPPLTGGRVGSLSTRTTHPVVFALFQDLLDAVQLRVKVTNPYRFKTKGEMLLECADQVALSELACKSTSCGRFKQFGYVHCGRCVPCLIRRSAFLRADKHDSTKYKYSNLSINNTERMRFDDVRSAKMAVERAKAVGVERWMGAALASGHISQGAELREVVRRGLAELEGFLNSQKVK